MKKVILNLIFLSICLSACNKNEDNSEDNSADRQRVIDDYNNVYLTTELSSNSWTGNTSNCIAGTVSAEAIDKAFKRINYFRRMTGFSETITNDKSLNPLCQEAALMCMANNQINHYPPASWKCFTPNGSTACQSSNLSISPNKDLSLPASITAFINDYGDMNTSVGHRRWILYSNATEFGIGGSKSTGALWVIQKSKPISLDNVETGPNYISWPPKGYCPASLVFDRWSFGKKNADLSKTEVIMKDQNGAPVELEVVSRATGPGDNSIVWEPKDINRNSAEDLSYTVNLTKVRVGLFDSSYTYKVTLIQPK